MLQRLLIFISGTLLLAASGYAANDNNGVTLQSVHYTPLADNRISVEMRLSKPLAQQPRNFALEQPPRIVIDLAGVSSALEVKDRQQTVDVGALRGFVVVEDNDRTRVILNLQQDVPFSLESIGSSVFVILSGSDVTTFSEEKQVTDKFDTIPVFSSRQNSITGFDFRAGNESGGKVIIDVADANIAIDVEQRGTVLLLRFANTHVPEYLVRRFDVTDFATPAQTVDIMAKGSDTDVRITTAGTFQYFSYQVNKQFIVEITPVSAEVLAEQESVQYTGERVSLNFQDIRIRTVLQLLAEFTGLNVVVSDAVDGNITLNLDNVPWDQALDIILKTRGLATWESGSVMVVAPAQEIAAQERAQLESQQQTEALEPIHSELLQVNYAKAADMALLLKDEGNSLLSSRGSVSVDARTNMLWIQDTPSQLMDIRELIQKLDVPVKQVLIEARIVIVSRDFARDLGIRWGFTRPEPWTLSGTLEGADAINDASPADPHNVDSFTERLNLDLAASPLSGLQPASVGIALANLGSDILLDLELSALESEQEAEVISSPRIVTADQQSALIEQGQEIPYQEATSSGATSVSFKKAVLSLQVTPHITPDDRILLDLQINQDQASTTLVVQNTPAIDTQALQTSVLVNNGETIVLGGIYQQTQRRKIERIPFLGTLPLIGALFRNTQIQNDRDELLVFITPSIIQDLFAVS